MPVSYTHLSHDYRDIAGFVFLISGCALLDKLDVEFDGTDDMSRVILGRLDELLSLEKREKMCIRDSHGRRPSVMPIALF